MGRVTLEPGSSRAGEVARLRASLLAFKRAADFDRAQPAVRLALVRPLIEAMVELMRVVDEDERRVHTLYQSCRLNPVYSLDATIGAEPLAMRWVVGKQPDFHNAIDALRVWLPAVSEAFRE